MNTTKGRILLVDDMPSNIKRAAAMLRGEGYEVHYAQDGQTALRRAYQEDFDLILLDIIMSGIDGLEVCRRLKAHEGASDIPVIMLTAKNTKQSLKEGFQAGAVDYVTKPFDEDELLARVSTHVSLHQKKQELAYLNASKNRFFSIMSHDLINNSSYILGSISLLKNRLGPITETDNKTGEFIALLEKAANNSNQLLNDLLTWGRSQMNQIQFEPQWQNVRTIFQKAYQNNEALLKNKKIRISIEAPADLNVWADENMLNTCLRNILSNAIKYSHRGEAIILRGEKKTDSTWLSVADNGIGMNDKQVANLFKLEKSVSYPGTEKEMGTGLGLLVTHEFITRHDGQIVVRSEPQKGSTFHLQFPTPTS